jgi:hypothetical protein
MCKLPALECPILLLGRSDAGHPRVHREGRNWIVTQDLIVVCHIHTYAHKKILRHMKLRAHTRNTAKSPVKNAFSVSFQRQGDASFAHCQVHNWWSLSYRMHVYSGGSDHMLYQRITVLTPVITVSWSSVPPSFLDFIVWKRARPVNFSTLTFQFYLREKSEDFCNMKSARFRIWVQTKK